MKSPMKSVPSEEAFFFPIYFWADTEKEHGWNRAGDVRYDGDDGRQSSSYT